MNKVRAKVGFHSRALLQYGCMTNTRLWPKKRQEVKMIAKSERIFSELINLCLDVVFTHGPQLFVKFGSYLMEAQVLDRLRGVKTTHQFPQDWRASVSFLWAVGRLGVVPGRAPPDCTWLKCCSVWPPPPPSASARFPACSSQAIWDFLPAKQNTKCSSNDVNSSGGKTTKCGRQRHAASTTGATSKQRCLFKFQLLWQILWCSWKKCQ